MELRIPESGSGAMRGGSAHPSLHQPNSLFDDRSIPLQSARHPNIRVEPDVPTKAETTATLPPKPIDIISLLHPRPIPHFLSPKTPRLQTPRSRRTMIDPNDDKPYCPCGNLGFDETAVPFRVCVLRRRNLRVLTYASLSIQ